MHLEGVEFRKLSENKAGKNGEDPQFLCIHPFLPSHSPFPAGCIPKILFWPSFPDICAGSALSWSIPHPACDSLQFPCLKGMMAWEKTSWGRLFKPSLCSSYWSCSKEKSQGFAFIKFRQVLICWWNQLFHFPLFQSHYFSSFTMLGIYLGLYWCSIKGVDFSSSWSRAEEDLLKRESQSKGEEGTTGFSACLWIPGIITQTGNGWTPSQTAFPTLRILGLDFVIPWIWGQRSMGKKQWWI